MALVLHGGLTATLANVVTVGVLGVLLMRGDRRRDMLHRTRLLLLAALATAFVSALMPPLFTVVAGHAPPKPWLNDVVALCYVPFTVAGLVSIPMSSRRVGHRARSLADGAVAATSLWYLMLGLDLRHGALHAHASGWAHVVTLAYPVGDVFVVATALAVMARCAVPARRMVAWVVAGLSIAAANDIRGNVIAHPGDRVSTVLYQSALLLLLGAAVAPAVVAVPEEDEARPTLLASAVGVWPFVPLLMSMALTTRLVIRGAGLPHAQVLPALAVAIALVARQLTGSRDRQRLVSRLQERERGLEAALRRDELTGLVNRLGLHEMLTSALGDAAGRPVTLCLLDLNDFKLINDNHGHGVGDAVLTIVAKRLAGVVRGNDVVARLGGDEFAVLSTGVARTDQEALSARLLAAFDAPIVVGSRRFTVSTSIGMVTSQPADTPEDLLAHADAAMYSAKEAKQFKSHIAVLSGDDRQSTARQLRVREEIAHPDYDQFGLVYQPVVDLATGRIRGIEALLRWNHPTLGPIAPDLFIPLAEQAGTIGAIGERVLRRATADLALLRDRCRGHRLAVGVNVSPRQLTDEHFVDYVLALMDGHALGRDQLVLEITEQAFEADVDALAAATGRLIDNGVSVAVDDFGTGYASLRYLHRLSLDVMKIDRSFVAETTTRSSSRQLVAALATMGATLGLQLVAEGIESIDQLRLLQEMNCELGQGYLFSPPVPIHDIERLVATGHCYPVGSGDAAPLASIPTQRAVSLSETPTTLDR
ncbi:MAG: bifunctional diguanylate cyclase/phosphodiesterase [Frankiales bacterium]|nr:bifunctional diguanylate cyclase/phosphodiesterase [Frankiales bacterium]